MQSRPALSRKVLFYESLAGNSLSSPTFSYLYNTDIGTLDILSCCFFKFQSVVECFHTRTDMSITLTRKTLFLIHRLHWYCTIMDATANCGCCKYVVCALMFFCILYSKNYPIFSNSHIAGSRQRSENNSSRNFSLMIPSVHGLHLQIHHTTHVYFVTYCQFSECISFYTRRRPKWK